MKANPLLLLPLLLNSTAEHAFMLGKLPIYVVAVALINIKGFRVR